jgi:hypothetical protein
VESTWRSVTPELWSFGVVAKRRSRTRLEAWLANVKWDQHAQLRSVARDRPLLVKDVLVDLQQEKR